MTRLGRIFLIAILSLGLAVVPALAGPKAVNFSGDPGKAAKFTGDPGQISFGARGNKKKPPANGGEATLTNPLSQVPSYYWYHGCSPTAGGMLMGYWALHGYPQLLPNVANPMVPGSQNPPSSVYRNISSPEHNLHDTYVGHPANSLADFMKTVDGGTYINDISAGLKNWSTYAGLSTAASSNSYVRYYGGSFSYTQFQGEIAAGRPMLLNLMTYTTDYGWVGHTVLAYGFQDNMFNLQVPNGRQSMNITVPGFAVQDTWGNVYGSASTQASWLGWNGKPVYPISQGGYVWWPFLDMTQTKGYSYANLWDWQVVNGVFYNPKGGSASTGTTAPINRQRVQATADQSIAPQYQNMGFSRSGGSKTARSSGFFESFTSNSRISGWSGGEGNGFEAVTNLMTFR